MFRNVASQKIQLFAFTTATGAPTTGDAANLTAYVTKDHGTPTALTDTSASEQSSTNAPGVYLFDLTQGETDANELTFSGKSSTSGVTVVPRFVSTFPATGILAPATAGRTLVVDAAGLADANMVKVGPTGAGTAQTARDIGASVLLSSGTGTGQISLSSGLVTPTTAAIASIFTTAVTEAYRADGAAPTLAQALCEILGHLGESSISGTTKTVKQFDGTTTAATFTLNDATTPTSITRAT